MKYFFSIVTHHIKHIGNLRRYVENSRDTKRRLFVYDKLSAAVYLRSWVLGILWLGAAFTGGLETSGLDTLFIDEEIDCCLSSLFGECLIGSGIPFAGGVAFDAEAHFRILLHELCEVVEGELGVVVEVGFALLKLSGVEVGLNFLYLLHIDSVADYYFLFYHLLDDLLTAGDAEECDDTCHYERDEEPSPPGHPFFGCLSHRGHIAVEVLEGERAFLAEPFLGGVELSNLDVVVPGVGDETLKRGLGPHLVDSHARGRRR